METPDSAPTKVFSAMEDGQRVDEFVEIGEAGKPLHPRNDPAHIAKMIAAHQDPDHVPKNATEPDNSFWSGVGGVRAARGVDNERPWHRLAIYLKSRGATNKEISERTGKTHGWVNNIVNQPWFREQVEATISEAGGEMVQEVLRGEVLNSIYTLVDVRDNPDSKGSDKIAAASKLIEQVLGKAPQTVTHVDGGRAQVAKEQEKLEAEIHLVEKELKELGVS